MESIIHTLGPEQTDSYRTLKYYLQKNFDDNIQIVLHENYDEIIEKLGKFKGEYFFIPTAYKSPNKNYGWTEFNFQHCDELEIADVLSYQTMPMYLISNSKYKKNSAIIHPATEVFIRTYLDTKDVNIEYASSKVLAYDLFNKYKYRYCIISDQVFEQDKESDVNIIKKFYPTMVWCLYKVKEN